MVGLFGSTAMPGEKPCGFVKSWNSRFPIARTSFSTASFSPDVALRMLAVSRSTWARSTLSSFQETRAVRSTKSRSSWLRGWKSAVQASIRPVNAAGILTRQDVELGGHAVRDAIEPRSIFSFLSPRPGAFLSVPSIGFNLAWSTHDLIGFSKERVVPRHCEVESSVDRGMEPSIESLY